MVQIFPPNPASSAIAVLKGAALAGLVAFGFALGLAWEHRGHTPGAISWLSGQSLAWRLVQSDASITAPKAGWSARLDQCHTNVATLEGSVAASREAVAAMTAESGRMVTKSDKATSAALSAAERASSIAMEIATRTPASPDLCVSADQLILDYAR